MVPTLKLSQTEEGEDDDWFWYLPDPSTEPDPATGEALQTVIQDVMDELLMLIHQVPEGQRKLLKNFVYQPQPSIKLMQRVLGCLECACASL